MLLRASQLLGVSMQRLSQSSPTQASHVAIKKGMIAPTMIMPAPSQGRPRKQVLLNQVLSVDHWACRERCGRSGLLGGDKAEYNGASRFGKAALRITFAGNCTVASIPQDCHAKCHTCIPVPLGQRTSCFRAHPFRISGRAHQL